MKKVSVTMLIFAACISIMACGASRQKTVQGKAEVSQEQEEKDVVLEKAMADLEIIKEYGIDEVGKAELSFIIKPETMQDCGSYYSIEADFLKPVAVSSKLKIGDETTIVVDEIKNLKENLTYTKKGYLVDKATGSEYYYNPVDGEEETVLYHDSDDRLESPFYQGLLVIRKDAIKGQAITNEYETVTTENISSDAGYFNGVVFDKEGYVTILSFIGD